MVASEVCSFVTLISFYTTRTFNHQSSCTALVKLQLETLLTSAPVCNCTLEQGWAQTVGVRHLPKSNGSSESLLALQVLQDEWVQMTVMGLGCQEQAEFEQRCRILPAILSALPLSPLTQTSMSQGAVDGSCLLCTGKGHVLATATWTTESSTLKEGHGVGRGLWGGGRLTPDIAQSCSVMRSCNRSTRNFPKAVADSFPKTNQLSFLYLWLRSHYVTCPP